MFCGLQTQEQPVTLGRRGPKSNQSPLEEEDPEADSHPQRTSLSHYLRPRSSQSPSEEEDPGAASHPQKKRTQEHPDIIITRPPLSPHPRQKWEDDNAKGCLLDHPANYEACRTGQVAPRRGARGTVTDRTARNWELQDISR
ncbi:hypothetical protein STEG23_000281 [Scotinomys teguina]